MSEVSASPAPADDEIDLGWLFDLLIDLKWWIVTVTVLFAIETLKS